MGRVASSRAPFIAGYDVARSMAVQKGSLFEIIMRFKSSIGTHEPSSCRHEGLHSPGVLPPADAGCLFGGERYNEERGPQELKDRGLKSCRELSFGRDGRRSLAAFRFEGCGGGEPPFLMWIEAQGTRLQYTGCTLPRSTGRTRYGIDLLPSEFRNFHFHMQPTETCSIYPAACLTSLKVLASSSAS